MVTTQGTLWFEARMVPEVKGIAKGAKLQEE